MPELSVIVVSYRTPDKLRDCLRVLGEDRPRRSREILVVDNDSGDESPEVARTVGGSYKQFRKGLSDMQQQLQIDDTPTSSSSYYSDDYDDYEPPAAPKFEPPTSEPTTSEPTTTEAEEV